MFQYTQIWGMTKHILDRRCRKRMRLLKYTEVSLGSVVDQDLRGGLEGQSSPSATSHTGFEAFS